ncbi:hypothetical protein [Chryseobacterium kwangjuense]|uniref:Uncharacterized protein n=1 Tax=Chryseobacterium kwangjuense TaxID=267125 RepID=A0A135WK32_9FLAO|nr:hypothetical protein [Chryseobacterium kwangjuense]KXH85274.1 hypothetical protein AU378_05845 [Chryseobacterium kwangjuense]
MKTEFKSTLHSKKISKEKQRTVFAGNNDQCFSTFDGSGNGGGANNGGACGTVGYTPPSSTSPALPTEE